MVVRMTNKKFNEDNRITDCVMSIWEWMNAVKVWAVHGLKFDDEQKLALKQECDSLFAQVSNSPICPGWVVIGFSRKA